jgi:hypothetical protein
MAFEDTEGGTSTAHRYESDFRWYPETGVVREEMWPGSGSGGAL